MKFPIALQLYSVRDDMAADFEGTLRKVNELYHIHLIPRVLEDSSADRIRQQGADALFDDAVFKQQVKLSPAVDAGIHLMLAAGHGEDAPNAAVPSGADSLTERGRAVLPQGQWRV